MRSPGRPRQVFAPEAARQHIPQCERRYATTPKGTYKITYKCWTVLLCYLNSHSTSDHLQHKLLRAIIVTEEEIQTVHLQRQRAGGHVCVVVVLVGGGVPSEVSGASLNARTI